MAESSVTLTAVSKKTETCACGCATCEQESCRLVCPTRPNFFCGQLLTDQDLTAIVTWTQERLRLQRFKLGWGVVCGLEVTRGEQDGHLVISPGYAVSCCGDDLVLCQPTIVDLSQTCLPKNLPCDKLNTVGKDEIFVDLMLQGQEEPGAFQTSLGCNGRHAKADCEPSRVVENTAVVPLPITDKTSPNPVDRWIKEYKSWWQHWFMNNPPPKEEETTLRKKNKNLEEEMLAWRYRLLEAFWHSPERDGCHICHQERGVPLARVCLHRDKKCEIVVVDAHPPARRWLSQDGWPAPAAALTYAPFLGRSIDEVTPDLLAHLHLHNITILDKEEVNNLQEGMHYAQNPFARYGSTVTLLSADFGKLGSRFVGLKTVKSNEDNESTPDESTEVRDDLSKVEGIKYKSAEALNKAGIYTFHQFLELSLEKLRQILSRPISNKQYQTMQESARKLVDEAASRE